jgi:hypothetical protein
VAVAVRKYRVTGNKTKQTLNLNQEQQKCRWPGSQLYQRRHSRFY